MMRYHSGIVECYVFVLPANATSNEATSLPKAFDSQRRNRMTRMRWRQNDH